MSFKGREKTLVVKGRDGKEKKVLTYGGGIKVGGNYCPKEDYPEYECLKCLHVNC